MGPRRKRGAAIAALLMLSLATASASAGPPPANAETPAPGPAWLPRYDLDMELDLAHERVRVRMWATWTNPQPMPTRRLVFNAHSRYVVPSAEIGLSAKTLELLRLDPRDSLGVSEPALEIHRVTLLNPSGAAIGQATPAVDLFFSYEGDTKTTLVVPLPCAIGLGQSATVRLDFTMHLPQKQGRWGQWQGVTTLSNWLPVFAYYGPQGAPPRGANATPLAGTRGANATPLAIDWQPTPFIPWHQPFFNESSHYRVRATLPADQRIACTGHIMASRRLEDGRQQVDIVAPGVRDFAFLCSARYRVFEGVAPVPPAPAKPSEDMLPAPRQVSHTEAPSPLPGVRIRVLAFAEHAHFAREMVRIASRALAAYSQWFGPYPWPDFTIAEAFFGWNGNECSTLVMVDERIFAMPHLAGGYVDLLVSHEICHQWWYNLVGTNGYQETWMDEGVATYFSHRLLNEKVGKNNNLMRFPRVLRWLPNIERETYRSYGLYAAIGRGDNSPLVQSITGFGHVANLFSMTYDKGSRVVGMIENRLGSPAFLDFMRRVFLRYRYRILRVADFQRELEAYTGRSWEDFFRKWLYGPGLTDWCIEKVKLRPRPLCLAKRRREPAVRVEVVLRQKAGITEQTVLGLSLPGQQGYAIRIPILPGRQTYDWNEPPAHIECQDDNRVVVEISLPQAPTQIAVDPDQILVDRDPSNNYWKMPVRYRFTPLYTFLEETDITTAYDRWNVIVGPWMYGTAYYDAWYTRTTATMIGFRAGLYRTQTYAGGVYTGYRTDYRDVVAGIDGLFDHWPDSHFQVGFDVEERLAQFYPGQLNAKRGVLFGRYIFKYGSSLYYPPMEFAEAFVTYQDNFLPFEVNPSLNGVRFDRTETAGFHYRRDYLTPYWNPEGGYRLDVWYEGGAANSPENVGVQKVSSQLSFVHSLPDFSAAASGLPWLHAPLRWLGESRIALRAYGGTSMPGRGEFFSMGGSMYFRGFNLAQRQGSTLWVGSVEWRLPVARGLHLDACDHALSLRNIDVVPFYDVGDVYISGHPVGPIAHAVGASFRFDVAWFSFVERTLLRFDIAKTLNDSSGTQFWFGVGVPF